jgi:hypothetical protein
LYIKFNKCTFAHQQLFYLGHIISHHGVSTDPAKTAAMVNWPIPQNFTKLRGFLGLTGYYRKFVKHYGTMARQLTNLLHHKNFSWDTSVQQAFDQLKQAMTTTPVLAFTDFSKEFVMETDECETGIGFVLTKEGHPIAYFSKGLSVTNQKLSTYEKELLVVMMTTDKWRCYLHTNPFIIKTHHQSFCHLQDQTLSTDLQWKAMRKMAGLQFKFAYKKGAKYNVADGLSRIGFHFHAISAVVSIWIQGVINSYHNDATATALLQELAVVQHNDQGYSLSNGVIRYKDRIWIENNSALQTKRVSSFHSCALGGHSGIQATYHRLKKMFY